MGRHYASALVSMALAVLLLSGCAAPPVQWLQPGPELVWPAPPDPPRIRFLRSLAGATDFREEGKGETMLRWLTGERPIVQPLVSPYGVAADGEGLVWVADLGIQAVHAIDLRRQEVTYLVSAGETALVAPVGLAYDVERERLYVADSALRKVFIFHRKGRWQGEVAMPGNFGRPGGLAVDRQGQLYVVDVLQGRVQLFTPDGVPVRVLESAAPPDYRFNRPANVAVDASGKVYVVDAMNFRLEAFDPQGRSLATIGQLGDGPGLFARPRGVAIDSQGHVYVVDAAFGNVQIFDSTGTLLTYFGKIGTNPGEFDLPSGICIDRHDRIYVADPLNNRVQIFQYVGGPS